MSETLASPTVPALAASLTLLVWSVILLTWSTPQRTTPNAPVRRVTVSSRRGLFPLVAGAAIAAWIWFVMDQPLIAAATMVLWMGGVRILRTRRDRAREATELQYAVEAIGTAGRALRSGIPMTGVLRILADETRGQTRVAFQEVVAREALGEDLASSIRAVLLPSPIPALRTFGLALIQQTAAGGNLAEVTDRLARSLVEGARIRRRVRTVLAYGRSAAVVLSITPVIAVPVLCYLVDGYASLLFDSPKGHTLLIIAALMLVIGGVSIQRMTGVDKVSAPGGGA